MATTDTNDLVQVTRALHLSGARNLRVIMADGSTVSFSGMAAWRQGGIRRVLSTGTTATAIVGCC